MQSSMALKTDKFPEEEKYDEYRNWRKSPYLNRARFVYVTKIVVIIFVICY